jgi:FkbM family methyltransferase
MRREVFRWSRFLRFPARQHRQKNSPADRLEHLARHAAGILTARLDAIEQRLDRIERRTPDRAAEPGGLAVEAGQYVQITRRLDVLERLSHGGRGTYVGNNRVLAKCVIGDFVLGYLVEADDLLLSPGLILNGSHEDDLVRFFASAVKKDSHCLDVGANYGFFACLFGKIAPHGKVVAIEPHSTVYELLCDNIRLNDVASVVTPMRAAVADSAAQLQLFPRVGRSGNTSITQMPDAALESLGEAKAAAFRVDALRIDDLLPQFANRIDFIKLDVEGAEPLALRGARQTIAANPRLAIVMEWAPSQLRDAGFDVVQFVDEIRAAGLGAADLGPGGTEELSLDRLLGLDYRAGILLRRLARR